MTHIDTRSAIRTKYVGPTNHRGTRISVSDYAVMGMTPQRMFVDWNYELDVNENHAVAAQTWLDKFNNIGEKYEQRATVNPPGLCFDGCYYWTWKFTPESET